MIIQGIIFAAPGFRYCNINLFLSHISLLCNFEKVNLLYVRAFLTVLTDFKKVN